ncbi:MAG: nuclear transport factor 2 family protein [Alphaproteobacteria bacterium]|jgi:ketosteroid isomerase-like protein|nr:nuclear transport factor 2 family protein [Alphaproteobacteria bacterium]
MPSRERVEAFIARVVSGAHDLAIEEFYTPDATMQENQNPPRIGRDTLVAQERAVMDRASRIVTHPVETWLIDGDKVVINWVFEFEFPDGRGFRMEELALQRWEGDRIAEERFFYDPGQRVLK